MVSDSAFARVVSRGQHGLGLCRCRKKPRSADSRYDIGCGLLGLGGEALPNFFGAPLPMKLEAILSNAKRY